MSIFGDFVSAAQSLNPIPLRSFFFKSMLLGFVDIHPPNTIVGLARCANKIFHFGVRCRAAPPSGLNAVLKTAAAAVTLPTLGP